MAGSMVHHHSNGQALSLIDHQQQAAEPNEIQNYPCLVWFQFLCSVRVSVRLWMESGQEK